MKTATMLLMLLCSLSSTAETTHGPFTIHLDETNAALPIKLTWKTIAIFDTKTAMNFSYTDFMYRTKYYREENKYIWNNNPDPRFVTDVTNVQTLKSEAVDSVMSFSTSYKTSYADVTRQIGLDKKKNVISLDYQLVFTAEKIIHEPMYFGLGLELSKSFSTRTVDIGTGDKQNLLKADGHTNARAFLNVTNPGPVLFSQKGGRAALVNYTWSGDIPSPVPTRQWHVKKGHKLSLRAVLQLSETASGLYPELRRLTAVIKPGQKAYRMFQQANLIAQSGDIPAAEALLLKAADADKTWSLPYSRLAQLRRNPKASRPLTVAEAFTYASYRQPYNYGWSLSGIDFPNDKRLSERESRQAIFNLLISVENCQFYAEYYVWVSRHFEQRKMYAQACAMHRQALWALDRLPRRKSYVDKQRAGLTAKLKELEKKLIEQPTAELPEMIEITIAK